MLNFIRSHLVPWYMSWGERAFRDFLNARNRLYGQSSNTIRLGTRLGLVSIVLPVYNGERYLADAIESIIAQTHSDWELIIVDDGSIDESGAIAEEYARRDSRIRLIRQLNKKLPAALNTGFAAAQGEFRTWTSCDNRYLPEFFELMIATLNAQPMVDLVFANYELINEDGKRAKNCDCWPKFQVPAGSGLVQLPKDVGALSYGGGNFLGAAFLYRDTTQWLIGDYKPMYFMFEDFDFFLRINARLTIQRIEDSRPLYQYRIHDESLTARHATMRIVERVRQLMALDDFRRDFLLQPVCWFFKSETDNEFLRIIEAFARSAGHFVMDETPVTPAEWPAAGFAAGLVFIADSINWATEAPPFASEIRGTRVLIYVGNETLPVEVHPSWNLCMATQFHSELPAFTRSNSWSIADRPEVAWSAIALRTVGHALDLLETLISQPPPSQCDVTIAIARNPPSGGQAIEIPPLSEVPGVELLLIDVQSEKAMEIPQIQELDGKCIRLVNCPFPGFEHVSQAALYEARGERIVILDAMRAIDLQSFQQETADVFLGHDSLGGRRDALLYLGGFPRRYGAWAPSALALLAERYGLNVRNVSPVQIGPRIQFQLEKDGIVARQLSFFRLFRAAIMNGIQGLLPNMDKIKRSSAHRKAVELALTAMCYARFQLRRWRWPDH